MKQGLHIGRNGTRYFTLRFSKADWQEIEDRAKARGVTPYLIIHWAILENIKWAKPKPPQLPPSRFKVSFN